MESELTALQRLEGIAQRIESPWTDELQAAVREVQCSFERSRAEIQRCVQLQTEAVSRSATTIEELERAQEEMQRLRLEAESANRAKSRFLANMSHEIRTPLSGILGFTKILLAAPGETDAHSQREFLETIDQNARHLLDLVNDLLDISKIEAGEFHVERVKCTPNRIVADVVSLLRVRAKQKGLHLEALCTGGVLVQVYSDPARLRQVLMNLIDNAIKFTDTGEIRVVSHFTDDEGDSRYRVIVSDTGVGIPPAKLGLIFQPLVQVDSSSTREFGGTGMGLAISRQIADALDGSLTVSSAPGQGSEFTLDIPTGLLERVESFTSPVPLEVLRHEMDVSEPPVVLNGRVLLVDDGNTNRKLVSLLLTRAGAEVATAANGQIAVDMAAQGNFDIVLMDMQMPVMDGYTATAELRKQGLALPIFALTAHAMKGDEQKCLDAGCTGYMTKPIDSDHLLRTVADALASEEKPDDIPSATVAEAQPLVSTLPMDDPEFREIAEEFADSLREKLIDMRAMWDARDSDGLRGLAHWLKGSAGSVGFDPFTEPATRLGQSVKNQQYGDARIALQEIEALAGRIATAPTVA